LQKQCDVETNCRINFSLDGSLSGSMSTIQGYSFLMRSLSIWLVSTIQKQKVRILSWL